MDAFRPVLLAVWQEACRHIEIQEAAENLAALLAKQLPLAGLLVRRLEPEPPALATVAAAVLKTVVPPAPHRQPLAPAQLRKLHAWARRQEPLLGARTGAAPELALVAPPDLAGEFLALPLTHAADFAGVLLLLVRPGGRLDAAQRRIAETLREPFSVALENDSRLHELTALREAAEADRRTLLTRLGRHELGETIVGADTGLAPVMERVNLVSPSDAPVLLLGETGSGKEVVARAIHARSGRSQGPFIRVNCGAIPAELVDSQLFGHEKGSFTGAGEQRQGWFERADGGTLFLDEIGELPLPAQVRLLRVLQDGYLERVGGQQPLRVDVRIVAATHRDLAAMVQTREFREDLWYRLAVFPIFLPPLRERRGDIPALARHFAERAAVRFGLSPVAPAETELALLLQYDWPGNIRELGAVIDRAAILGDGKSLAVAAALGVIPPRAASPAAGPASAAAPGAEAAPVRPKSAGGSVESLDEAIRRHIELALAATRGRIEGPRGAAALLQINPHTLRAKMRKLRIAWERFRD